MTKSESIAALATALAKAQGMLEKALKSSSNPYFKSKYANLESAWDACRDALSKNGLSVTQLIGSSLEGKPQLTTMLLHSSGEYIYETVTMAIEKQNPQEVGKSITYYKRYGLIAIVGLADEDDDGETAMGRKGPQGHPVTQGTDYILRSGAHKGKKISELTEKQIDTWLTRYDSLKGAGDLIHPDVERDTKEIIDYKDSQTLAFEELHGSKRENK
jgi:ERF superfamily